MGRVRVCGKGRRCFPRRRWRRRLVLGRRWRPVAAVPAGAARGAQPAFRIQQEHARGHDPFTLFQAGADLDPVSQLHAKRDRPRFESVPGGDKDVLLQPGVDHRVTRDGDHLGSGGFKGHGAVESRSEGAAGIRRRKADA